MVKQLAFFVGFMTMLLLLMVLGFRFALNGLAGAPELQSANTEVSSGAR